jgi:lipopolysaccharide export system permease protein
MILDRYLLRESLPTLLFGVVLYSSLVILSATIPRIQWIRGVPLGDLLYWLALQFPAALVQTLPIALLLAALLTFGRLAAANELLAMQAGGIALRRTAAIFALLGALAAAGALLVNNYVLPRTNALVGSLWWQLTSDGSGLFRLAQQNIPLGPFNLYFERTDRLTDELFNVRVESWSERTLTVVHAARAGFEQGGLRLFDYDLTVLNLASLEQPATDPAEALQQLVRVRTVARGPGQSLLITTSESLDELITRFSGGGFLDTRSLREAYQQMTDAGLSAQQRREAAVLFHRLLAEPLANLTLLLIAVPLAVLHARSRSVAFGLSLVVTLAWYLLLTIGQLLAQGGWVPVWVGLWAGNLVLGCYGLYLLLIRTNLR